MAIKTIAVELLLSSTLSFGEGGEGGVKMVQNKSVFNSPSELIFFPN